MINIIIAQKNGLNEWAFSHSVTLGLTINIKGTMVEHRDIKNQSLIQSH